MNIALLSDGILPNLALMKIATYHKLNKDSVEIFNPLFSHLYDITYYSKIFTFTKANPYVKGCIIKGGTGFDITKKLQEEIDCLLPDYSIYPDCDYALGFITRGCIRRCPFCVVPEKEGFIQPYRSIEQIARKDTNKILFMDNNVLSSEFGINELIKLSESKYRVDFNQGLDARLINREIAKILMKINWLKYIRISCDHISQLDNVFKVLDLLKICGYSKRLFVYVLLTDEISGLKILNSLRHKDIIPFAQPYRDIHSDTPPPRTLIHMARWCNVKSIYKTVPFNEYKYNER